MIKFETFTLYTLILDGSWHKVVAIAVLSVYVRRAKRNPLPQNTR